jgi:AcrR family transcriptional regulator
MEPVAMADEVRSDNRVPLRRSVTRERILAAAADSFLRKGFHGSSVESIATAAGYTTGAIYSNFKDKDGLFLAVARERFQRFYAVRYRELERARTTKDMVAIMSKIAAERDATYYLWGVASFEFTAYAIRNAGLQERLRESIRTTLNWMERVLAPAAERCGVPAPIFAQAVAAVADGSAMLKLSDDSIDEPGLVTLILSRIMSTAPTPDEERR